MPHAFLPLLALSRRSLGRIAGPLNVFRERRILSHKIGPGTAVSAGLAPVEFAGMIGLRAERSSLSC
jgi:hypothetical protein